MQFASIKWAFYLCYFTAERLNYPIKTFNQFLSEHESCFMASRFESVLLFKHFGHDSSRVSVIFANLEADKTRTL